VHLRVQVGYAPECMRWIAGGCQGSVQQLSSELNAARSSQAATEVLLQTARADLESARRQLAGSSADSDQWASKYRIAEADRAAAVAARDAAQVRTAFMRPSG
jgi:hypothetical protein